MSLLSHVIAKRIAPNRSEGGSDSSCRTEDGESRTAIIIITMITLCVQA